MKYLVLIVALLLLSCKFEKADTAPEKKAATNQSTEIIKPTETSESSKHADYNGDGQPDDATVKLIKEGQGNPIEDGTPPEYSIVFNGKFPEIPIGCCDAIIIEEGDLDNDGTNEFSVLQSPMNGCTYSMTTYSFKKGIWKQLVKTFLIPTGCDEVSTEDLEKRVFTENGKIYFMETDMSNEDMKLIKKEARL